jgi:hypothetical protein
MVQLRKNQQKEGGRKRVENKGEKGEEEKIKNKKIKNCILKKLHTLRKLAMPSRYHLRIIKPHLYHFKKKKEGKKKTQ